MTTSLNSVDSILEEIANLHEKCYIQKHRESDILFITGCTSRKTNDKPRDYAHQRYTGISSRRMLSFFAYQRSKKLKDMYVMSAGYGLIPAQKKIKYYDVTFQKFITKKNMMAFK